GNLKSMGRQVVAEVSISAHGLQHYGLECAFVAEEKFSVRPGGQSCRGRSLACQLAALDPWVVASGEYELLPRLPEYRSWMRSMCMQQRLPGPVAGCGFPRRKTGQRTRNIVASVQPTLR